MSPSFSFRHCNPHIPSTARALRFSNIFSCIFKRKSIHEVDHENNVVHGGREKGGVGKVVGVGSGSTLFYAGSFSCKARVGMWVCVRM
mmetsp:Transcript_23203/g.58822  ORF Transcript_23203/g.58822 Transcript_23203/m.58822 type:complete len:88 (-) Transcript_23203:1288-1551(-)